MLVIDIGNSSTRLALYQKNKYVTRLALRTADLDLESLYDWLGALPQYSGNAAIASVSGKACEAVQGVLSTNHCHSVLVLDPTRHRIIPHDLLTPETTGVDRLCAARAAWEYEKQATVVVDAGTAITIDAVDNDGVFLGGAILPGGELWLRSLHTETAQLPEVDLKAAISSTPEQGRSTAEALYAGLAVGLPGAVASLVQAHRRRLDGKAELVITGGAGEWLRDSLKLPAKLCPDLVLDGIRFAATSIMEGSDG
ncbi:MAG: type III pantothenate kinase [Planctomycetes bacterium]|nr:type III pantothenate kinase [Planctomycetota bacterium]